MRVSHIHGKYGSIVGLSEDYSRWRRQHEALERTASSTSKFVSPWKILDLSERELTIQSIGFLKKTDLFFFHQIGRSSNKFIWYNASALIIKHLRYNVTSSPDGEIDNLTRTLGQMLFKAFIIPSGILVLWVYEQRAHKSLPVASFGSCALVDSVHPTTTFAAQLTVAGRFESLSFSRTWIMLSLSGHRKFRESCALFRTRFNRLSLSVSILSTWKTSDRESLD